MRPVFSRSSLLVMLALLLGFSCSDCTDEVKEEPIVIDTNNSSCPDGEIFNPIAGTCQTKVPTVGPGPAEQGFPNPPEDKWAEQDGDGVPDRLDNCPYQDNADQLDDDRDGIGNLCDNCVAVPNPAQTDSTGTGSGDACSAQPVGDICDTQMASFQLLEPNLYILFDKSGSMGQFYNCFDPSTTGCCPGCLSFNSLCCAQQCCEEHALPWPIDAAKTGLDAVADALADKVRFGFAAYPLPAVTAFGDASCESTELLPVGKHTAQAVKQSYTDLVPEGATPTGNSLFTIRTRGALNDPNDPNDAGRAKAVILITDGEPNVCEDRYPAVAEAQALSNAGINTYVVGFVSEANEQTLNAIAQAGGTDNPNDPNRRFYVAENTAELVDVVSQISEEIVDCAYILDPKPGDTNKIWVKLNGELLPREGYDYEPTTAALQLNGQACETLKAVDVSATSLEIVLGCPTECDPEVFWGCCKRDGEACETDSDCCFTDCVDGVCKDPCRPTGVSCQEDSQCCSSVCGGPTGSAICIAQ